MKLLLKKNVERLLASIVDSSDDAIISKDLDGIVTSWNRAAEKMFGYSASEMIGRSITLLIPSDRQDEEPRILAQLCRGEAIDHYETIRQRKDGSLLDVSLTVSPIRDEEGGSIIGASKIARDISERKRADRAREQFFATLSHELRTPLMPVLMNISLLRKGTFSAEEMKRILDRMEYNIQAEVRLVDELLDLSRIIHRKLEMRKEPVAMRELLTEIAENLKVVAGSGRRVELSISAVDDTVLGDSDRLRQVFRNLLDNAIKFSPPGSPLRIKAESSEREIRIWVQDEGIGFDGDFSRMFLPFEQEYPSQGTRKGLGLGLAISKGIVEAHGGTLGAFSRGRNQGSCFRVSLPLLPREEVAHPNGNNSSGSISQ